MSRVDGRSQKERLEAGELYVADDPVLQAELRRAARLTKAFNDSAPDDVERTTRPAGGAPRLTRRGCRDPAAALLRLRLPPPRGSRTFVNFGLVALDVATISIGEDVQVGPNVQLLTATHPLEPEPRRAKWEAAQPIAIGDNAWLGGGVIVCPGVTIGADTVVGAGSVVTGDLPAGVLAVGSPARVVRELR